MIDDVLRPLVRPPSPRPTQHAANVSNEEHDGSYGAEKPARQRSRPSRALHGLRDLRLQLGNKHAPPEHEMLHAKPLLGSRMPQPVIIRWILEYGRNQGLGALTCRGESNHRCAPSRGYTPPPAGIPPLPRVYPPSRG